MGWKNLSSKIEIETVKGKMQRRKIRVKTKQRKYREKTDQSGLGFIRIENLVRMGSDSIGLILDRFS